MNKRNFLILTSLKKKVTSKWFIGINIFILVALVLIFNIGNIIALFGGDFQKEKTLYLIDRTDHFTELKQELEKHSKDFSNASDYKIKTSTLSMDELKAEAKKDQNILILEVNKDPENYISATIYSKNSLSYIAKTFIATALKNVRYDIAIKEVGLTKEQLFKINNGVEINSILLQEVNNSGVTRRNTKADAEVGAIVMVVMILPFFFLIVTLVQMIGAEINEEKTSKSMEYIITNVSPKDHLIAKIVSCTAFTFIQILSLVLAILIASFVKSQTANIVTDTSEMISSAFKNFITPEIFTNILHILPILITFFAITLISYAVLASVLASMTTNIDDFQQLQTPLMLIVSIGFYLAIFAIIYNGSNFIKVMSFVPLVSLLISPALYMLGEISILSIIISMIIQLVFLIIVYKKGLKVYKVGILNYSGEHLWKKIFKALKS